MDYLKLVKFNGLKVELGHLNRIQSCNDLGDDFAKKNTNYNSQEFYEYCL